MRTDLRQALHGAAGRMGGGGGDSGSERAGSSGAAGGAGRRGGVIGEDLLRVLSESVSETVGVHMEKMMEVGGGCCMCRDYDRGVISHSDCPTFSASGHRRELMERTQPDQVASWASQ
jgi:hypothetical protein